ncbi:TIGR02300 family protein, partial [Pelagibius sp.]|uniref:TIGR02300 family protein n=1 Tax=Pelagibius sp. TaxID=1931238 RepID=UPI0026287356
MADPKWGTKRICQSCGTKFYDLRKSPIICPSCGAEFDPEALLKSRRSRPAPKSEPAPKAAAAAAAAKPADEEADGNAGEEKIDLEDAEADAMIEEAGDEDEDD